MLIAMTRTTRRVPFRGHETWVQITAPDDASGGALPLFVLHGGPGMAHNYVRNIAELAAETGRTVIHYDQIGCGNSTHLPDSPADFWTPELFVDEFHTVRDALSIDEYHLLGQSWAACSARRSRSANPPGSRHWRSATRLRRWSSGWREPPSFGRSCRRTPRRR
jgi:L-proline amide hydrolase